MVAESQGRAQIGLEVAELEDGEDTVDGDGEEAGAVGHHGSAGFTLTKNRVALDWFRRVEGVGCQ